MKKFQPYPGTRDFYPNEMFLRNWFFEKQREVCRNYGYEEYSAPILEYTDLYRSKSSEEIVNEQLYTFIDRGNREVSIRPEMTPTLARMIANRDQSYVPPLRWFSIANFMRYERPGKGRLREFYQLNVDLIGSNTVYSDVEILSVAMDILKSYGANEDQFIVRFSHRALLDLWLGLTDKEKLRKIGRIIDKKEKITQEEFDKELKSICEDKEIKAIYNFFQLRLESYQDLLKDIEPKSRDQISDILNQLSQMVKYLSVNHNPKNLIFDPTIVRGFDYYTGLIFEIYDTHPENRRAIFGGGRYDNLIGQFSKESLPAIGFGMGDVTLEAFLKNHRLIPEISTKQGFYFTLFDENLYSEYLKITHLLRKNHLPIEISLSRPKKLGKEFELAEKKGYQFCLILGEDELKKQVIKVKDLTTGKETELPLEETKFIDGVYSLMQGYNKRS